MKYRRPFVLAMALIVIGFAAYLQWERSHNQQANNTTAQVTTQLVKTNASYL